MKETLIKANINNESDCCVALKYVDRTINILELHKETSLVKMLNTA